MFTTAHRVGMCRLIGSAFLLIATVFTLSVAVLAQQKDAPWLAIDTWRQSQGLPQNAVKQFCKPETATCGSEPRAA